MTKLSNLGVPDVTSMSSKFSGVSLSTLVPNWHILLVSSSKSEACPQNRKLLFSWLESRFFTSKSASWLLAPKAKRQQFRMPIERTLDGRTFQLLKKFKFVKSI